MAILSLRNLTKDDVKYFKKWWRDEDLIKLTSGDLTPISDDEIYQYFTDLFNDQNKFKFMIVINNKTIGNISLSKKTDDWYEMQIVIGEKDEWGKGYGTDAVNELFSIAKKLSIHKIFLEVRPTNIRAVKSYEKCGFKQKDIIKYPKNTNLSETIRMEIAIDI